METPIPSQFDQLCALLEDELERQETLLALLQAQRTGLAQRDRAYLEAKSSAMQALVAECAAEEPKRHALLRDIVAHFGLAPDRQTLSELVAIAPEAQQRRLAEVQTALQNVLDAAKEQVYGNVRSLRRAMHRNRQAVDAFEGHTPGAAPYTPAGAAASSARPPSLLDATG